MIMILGPLPIAYRLATLIESVVDPLGHSPVLSEEPTIDQAPEVEHATDNIWIATRIDAARRGIPLVPCGLLRFVERRGELEISGRVEGAGFVHVEGMTVGCNPEDDLTGCKASASPSLYC